MWCGLASAVASAALAGDDKQARTAVDNFVSAPGDGYEQLDALLWAMDGGPVALMGAALGERPPLHVTLAAGLINGSDSETRVSAVFHAGETIRRWRSVTAACVDLLGRAANRPKGTVDN